MAEHTLHPSEAGPFYVDDYGAAQIVICPDCGQLEWWSQRETEDHGLCRSRGGTCDVCDGE